MSKIPSLRNLVLDAKSKGLAIGHFNVSTLEMVQGIVRSALKCKAPVIIGVSEGERDFIGINEIVALISSLRNTFNHPIYLNADHTYSFERVKEAIDAGFDSVIYDGAPLSFEENLANTKKCVEYANEYKKKTGKDVLVEAELGYIGQSSKVFDKIPDDVNLSLDFLTKAEEAKKFVKESGIDLFAPAVGNVHGMLKGGHDPKLNIDRVTEISKAVGIPLVLHGGSGNSEEDFKGAVKNGCSIVHVSTELRLAYRTSLITSLSSDPDEVAPYRYMKAPIKAIEMVVENKINLFGYKI